MSKPPAVTRVGVFRVEADDLVIVLYRLLVLLKLPVCKPPVVMRVGVLGVEADDLVIVLYRL